ncbi:LuxR family transcriptional regulator [Serratia proteamaculans]|uniref:Helix-turn-helix transcriptional regulator n=1 Tax=Serratia proteamaculans TaxID=28151 RepID=A0A5Q2VGV7_SERPR|nr:LuxR C-terminal-related transcriptional regulator [Serratia proteamaculans]QGH63260.1 helix-turn-helix transcriptional regulator [Serratia proteamaculans]
MLPGYTPHSHTAYPHAPENNASGTLPPSLTACLTPREAQIIQALMNGMDLSAIAWKLSRNIRTVSSHKQRAMYKLRLNTNAELYALAALLGPHLPATVIARRRLLPPREQQVLNAILRGHSVTDIAQQQGRSVKTISYQKCQLMQKLGLTNEVELFALAPERAQALLTSKTAQ